MSDKSEKLIRNSDIVWRREIDDPEVIEAIEKGEDISEMGTVILVISDMIHELNFIGGRIWMMCDGTKNEDEIICELMKIFDADRNELTEDVRSFISKLTSDGWLNYV